MLKLFGHDRNVGNVAFGSKADIKSAKAQVRFAAESGHSPRRAACPRCAKSSRGGSGDRTTEHRTRPELSRNPLQRRSLPLPVQRLGFRPVKPHDNEERSLGRGQPVGLLVGAGGFVLEVEGKPAVGILFELRDHRRVQQIPIEGIGYHQLRGEIVHGH